MEITRSTLDGRFTVYHLGIPEWIEPESLRKKQRLSFPKYHKQVTDMLGNLFGRMTSESGNSTRMIGFVQDYYNKIHLSTLFNNFWTLMTHDRSAPHAGATKMTVLKDIGAILGGIMKVMEDERIKGFSAITRLMMTEFIDWVTWFVVRIEKSRVRKYKKKERA